MDNVIAPLVTISIDLIIIALAGYTLYKTAVMGGRIIYYGAICLYYLVFIIYKLMLSIWPVWLALFIYLFIL